MLKFTSFINKVVAPFMRRTQKILRPGKLTTWAMKGSAQWLPLREEQFSKGTLKELNKIQGQADRCSTPMFRKQNKNKQKKVLPSELAASGETQSPSQLQTIGSKLSPKRKLLEQVINP